MSQGRNCDPGGVITSAGLVLAGTVATLGTLPLVILTEIGFTVALGVLLDTLVVRSVLVTALTWTSAGTCSGPAASPPGGRPTPRPPLAASCPAPSDRPGPRQQAPRGPGRFSWHVQLAAVESGSGREGSPDGLVVRTVPVADPGNLIVQLPGPGSLAWIRQGEGLAGWGEVARVTVPAGQDRFTAADKWLRALLDGALIDDRVGAAGCGPVAFGSFTFDPTSEGSVLILPQVILGRRGGQAWLTTITGQPPGPPNPPLLARYGLDQAGLADRRPDQARLADARVPRPPAPGVIRWHDGSLTAPQWERAVAVAVDRIKAGRLQKVVLARDLYASASRPIDERLLLARLADRYPDCYTFACGGLVGATPELLIKRQDLQISSLVLAGTAPRGDDPARDAALGTALLASAKDTEEHGYAAAGVRESLAPLCDQLTVAPRPALLLLANVQHLATTISGRLAVRADGTSPSVLALADALHPTAAVCGTPAETAMELIRELEGMDRGRYAGPVGWVDSAGNGEWGIALRCAELDGTRARLFAGGGIVTNSDPEAELAETQAKLRPMQSALEG